MLEPDLESETSDVWSWSQSLKFEFLSAALLQADAVYDTENAFAKIFNISKVSQNFV